MKIRSIPIATALVLLCAASLSAAQGPQVPLSPVAIPQFVQPLPLLSAKPYGGTINTVAGNGPLTLRMCEFRANTLPANTAIKDYTGTWVWGYLVDPSGDTPCEKLIWQYANFNGVIDTFTGPVIVNQRYGPSTDVRYINELGDATTTQVLAWKYSSDQTLHWADPLTPWPQANLCSMMGGIPLFGEFCAQNYEGPIAAVPHLHGGEVPAEIDGSPDSWFTSDGQYRGHKYYTAKGGPKNGVLYHYPNLQEAAPAWFHDHTLGATRLNVYAGLAGAYLIDDPKMGLPKNFPKLNELIPMVIQDRMFDEQGQLFFQADSAGGTLWATNPEHPYWKPEFIGDTILVNGKAWPYLDVEPRRYTFLFLNGSNARTYEMYLSNPSITPIIRPNGNTMYVVATDGGFLDEPVKLFATQKGVGDKLLIMPGERYMVTIDFSAFAPGTTVTLNNVANAPYPSGDPVDPRFTGRIAQFRVGKCYSGQCGVNDPSFDPSSGKGLRDPRIVRLADPIKGVLAPDVKPAVTRQLTLNEIAVDFPRKVIDPVTGVPMVYPGGPLEILVNNTKWNGNSPRPYGDFTPITVNGVTTNFSEMPTEGNTEVWEIVNLTADAHPIHLHLVQFQILNREGFNTLDYITQYEKSFPSGVYEPDFGPPFDYRAKYNPMSGGKDGGNPDVTPYLDPLTFSPPNPMEAGWKDTIMAPPDTVTRVVVRWAPTDLPVNAMPTLLHFPFDPTGGGMYNYVWHCHIIDHEDNEMMRPDTLSLNPLSPPPYKRQLVQGIHY
ncbi:MAG: multicopper oxidase domain-containing protein [Acidobacteria bacterium]|nr:multicopper oxidase domain-containing protein [Acidobacteriota bacterium]